MATQQVVVMGTEGGTTMGAMGTNQQPTQVVVVQQQQPTQVVMHQVMTEGDRYPRYAYLIFTIGFFLYHFFWTWTWVVLSFAPGGYGALFFFCGCIPALVAWIWIINDGTVFCANPGSGPITKMCCCTCVNGYIMSIPVASAALLRLILWFALFGIFADFLNAADISGLTDEFFWVFVCLGSLDVGPYILLAIDWWWYYGKADYDALFGTKIKPLRCIVGESIVIVIHVFAFIALLDGIGDTTYTWPWICHGVVSLAILIFAAFLQFSGGIQGAVVSNNLYRFIAMGLGVALTVLILIVWGYFLSWAFSGWSNAIFAIALVIYGLYYSGLTVPTVWALFSLRTQDGNQQNAAV